MDDNSIAECFCLKQWMELKMGSSGETQSSMNTLIQRGS